MVFNKGKRNHLRSKDLPHCIRYEVLLLDSLPLFWAKSFSDSMAGESNLCSIGEETVELGVGLHWQFEISLYFDEELQQVSLPLPEQMLEVTTFAKAGRLDMPLALLRETHSCVKTTCSYIWMHVYQCLSTMNSRVKLQCVPRPKQVFFAFDLRSGRETALISGSEIQIQESTVRFVAVAVQMLAPSSSLFQCLGSCLIWERAESPSKRSLSVKPTWKCVEKVKTCVFQKVYVNANAVFQYTSTPK